MTTDFYNKDVVYYISGEQLSKFIKSGEGRTHGYGYGWSCEGVIHIYFRPLEHNFGKQYSVSIAKEKETHFDDVDICINIDNGGTPKIEGKTILVIPSRENLYCRNKGLIELDVLSKKRVLIVGVGSGGSAIALDLAKAGVGQFALADYDRLELHNLSRHICSINDLGRLKTDAVADAIKGKNPYAIVDKYPININDNLDLLEEQICKADIVMACTDNNRSRFNISELLVKHEKIGIFGRAVTRAEGGDVFIYRPGSACYFCLLGNDWYDQTAEEITNLAAARREGRIPAYVSEEDADALVQVGLNADIEPITNMMVKLALMELSRGTASGITTLEQEFKANYYMWANRRERYYTQWGCLDNTQGLPTIMRWYAINISQKDDCCLCSAHGDLKGTGDAYMQSLKDMGSNDLGDISLSDISTEEGLQR